MLPARLTRNRAPQPGTFEPTDNSSRHIALYIQLASIFRHKILSQAWSPGFKLPALEILAAEFKVSRITVRQAVGLLVQENLLTSSRGRGTFVRPLEDRHTVTPIDPMGTHQATHQIVVTGTSDSLVLPADFQGDCGVYDRYTLIEKIHLEDGRPFATVQIYIPTVVYKRIPKQRIEKQKILTLVLDSGDVAETLKQIMTVEPADYYLSERLDYPFGSPVARIMRRVVDHERRLVYAGAAWYRGDRFLMSMTLPTAVVQEMPPEVFEPSSRR